MCECGHDAFAHRPEGWHSCRDCSCLRYRTADMLAAARRHREALEREAGSRPDPADLERAHRRIRRWIGRWT